MKTVLRIQRSLAGAFGHPSPDVHPRDNHSPLCVVRARAHATVWGLLTDHDRVNSPGTADDECMELDLTDAFYSIEVSFRLSLGEEF